MRGRLPVCLLSPLLTCALLVVFGGSVGSAHMHAVCVCICTTCDRNISGLNNKLCKQRNTYEYMHMLHKFTDEDEETVLSKQKLPCVDLL